MSMKRLLQEMLNEHPKPHSVEYYATVLELKKFQVRNYIRTLKGRGWLNVTQGISRPYYALRDDVKDAILLLGVENVIRRK